MASVVHNRPNNRIHDASFDSDMGGRSKTAYATTNFDMSAYNTSHVGNTYANDVIMKRSKGSLPKLSRERSRDNKMYRTPPTPPPDKLIVLERSFTLDCIAVGNISEDYSTANPKLGSAIPPYDARNDKAVARYMKNYGVHDVIRNHFTNTKNVVEYESIPGKVHDKFNSDGLGFHYLRDRNRFGNGHHAESFEGHSRFMGDHLRNMFSYNNMHGFRRNVPRLRSVPSTFTADKKQMIRLNKSFQNHYSKEEIKEHFKNTYESGFPHNENDYREFYPPVRYFITVKVGENSSEHFKNGLNINIIAKTYASGFIQLDNSIAYMNKTKDERAKSIASTLSTKKFLRSNDEEEEERENLKLFQKGKEYVFSFEDKDIRTISGIILAKEGKEDLFIDYVLLEIHKAKEKKIFRFPYNGFVNSGNQTYKAETIKRRFAIQNSVFISPNEIPQFEYKIRTTPQLFSKTEYITKIECDIEDENAPVQYRISLQPAHLPLSSTVSIKLFGANESTDFIRLNDHKLVLREQDVGKIKSALITYDRRPSTEAKNLDWFVETVTVTKSNSETYVFNVNKNFKPLEKIVHKVDEVIVLSEEEKKKHQLVPVFSGKLCMVIEGDKGSTNTFNLLNPILSSDKKTFTFKTYTSNVGNIQAVSLKYVDKPGCVCNIKNIKVSRNKDIFEYDKNVKIAHESEIHLPEGSNTHRADDNSKRKGKPAQLLLKLVGDNHSTDYFALEDPLPGSNDSDMFMKISRDIGKLNNVHLKYLSNDKRKVYIESIEITNPRGEKFSFPVEVSFKSGDESILPKSESNESSNDATVTTSTDKNHLTDTFDTTDTKNFTNEASYNTTNQSRSPTTVNNLSKTPTTNPSKTPSTEKVSSKKSTPTQEDTNASNTSSQAHEEKIIEYNITTRTANKLNAGTDANVYIIINGEKKSTIEFNITNSSPTSRGLFEMGKKDDFQVQGENVGKIKSIQIRHDGIGLGSSWNLDSVTVSTPNQRIEFTVNKILSESDGLSLTLYPNGEEKNHVINKLLLDLRKDDDEE